MNPLAALLFACPSPPPVDPPAPEPSTPSVAAPTLVALSLADAGPLAPLTRLLAATTDRPTSLRVSWADEHGPIDVQWPALATEHDVVLVGFHPDATVPLSVALTDADGATVVDDSLTVTTDPLPDAFATRTVLSADPARVQPGLDLMPMRALGGSPYDDVDYLVALDADGHVVWLYANAPFVYDVRLQPNGVLLVAEQGRIVEIDRAGRELAAWRPVGWDAAGIEIPPYDEEFHHDVFPMADGGLLALTWLPRHVDDYPTSYSNPTLVAPAEIAEDVVFAFDRDGSVRWSWPLGELVDVHRIGFDSLRPRTGLVDPPPEDWDHANAVVEAADGSILVSMRHQDAVIRFDPATGALRWILANHDNWPAELQPYLLEPIGDLAWPYHQHAPELGRDDASGTDVLLFDNGNGRASPWTGAAPLPDARSWSRAVAYHVDEQARTVTQTFSYVDNPNTGPIYASQIGDADWLDNGNVLVTYGHATWFGGQTTESLGLSEHVIRVVEVEPVSGDTVWDLQIATDPATDPLGWTGNRTQRVADLYPELPTRVRGRR